MSLESGNSLFRNRKVPASELSLGSAGGVGQSFEELKERVIILCKEDILAGAPARPLLNWSAIEGGEIAVQLKDTEGLTEGRVTIKASSLQRIHPALLPMQLEAEYLFPVSLKTVVLQLQSHLRQSSEEKPEQVGADFDTPIAQVAREDEGFFKLAKVAEAQITPIDETAQPKRKIAGPVLTPADRPSPPMFYQKLSPHTLTGTPSPSDPVGSPSFRLASSGTESRQAERAAPTIEAVAQSSLRRTGLERLQEIFMMDD